MSEFENLLPKYSFWKKFKWWFLKYVLRRDLSVKGYRFSNKVLITNEQWIYNLLTSMSENKSK